MHPVRAVSTAAGQSARLRARLGTRAKAMMILQAPWIIFNRYLEIEAAVEAVDTATGLGRRQLVRLYDAQGALFRELKNLLWRHPWAA